MAALAPERCRVCEGYGVAIPGLLHAADCPVGIAQYAEMLTGAEGEVVFVRRDLAQTETAARAYALEHDGCNLTGYEVDEVEMLPVPDYFIGLDVEWATVRPGTPAAVRFWRFQL